MTKRNGVISCSLFLLLTITFDNVAAKSAEVSAISLDVLRVKACAVGQGCSTVGGPKQINLFDLAEGKTDFAKQVLLPARTQELRLLLGKNSTIAVDGQTYPLTVPSGQDSGLKLKGQKVFGKTGGFLADITLDFDLAKGLVVTAKKVKGKGKNAPDTMVYSYSLKPVIEVASAEIEPLPKNMAAVVALPDEETVLKEGNDDLVVTIPAGAIPEPTVIIAKKIENAFYELHPDGQKFVKPVTIAMSYRDLFYREAGYTDNELIILRNGVEFPSSIDIESETMSVSTKEFSDYMIIANKLKGTIEKDVKTTLSIVICGQFAVNSNPEVIPIIMRDKLKWNTASDFMEHWIYPDTVKYSDLTYNKDIVLEHSDVSKYSLISGAFSDLRERAKSNTLFSGSLEYLVEGLKRTLNDKGLPVIPYGGPFNHIEMELNSAGNIWNEAIWDTSHMFFSVEKPICNTWKCQYDRYKEKDEYVAAFGSSSVRAVARGEVKVTNDIAEINIDQAGLYFRDSYDFTGGDNNDFAKEQFLGCWSTEEPYLALNPFNLENPTCVCNLSFRKYNYHETSFENRRDFRIFTNPEEYTVDTNQSLQYKIPDTDPYVKGVISSKNAEQYRKLTFTVTGRNLPPDLALNFEDCINIKLISNKTTEVQFTCEPIEPGLKKGELRYGVNHEMLLYTFTVPIKEQSPACINGGLYCGSAITDSSLIISDSLYNKSKTLYKCTNGFFVEYELCDNSCVVSPPGKNDICGCPDEHELYCGWAVPSLPLDSDTLYKCVNGVFSVKEVCDKGCMVNFSGEDHKCSPFYLKVSPDSATLNVPTVFTVTGQNLPSTLTLSLDGCNNMVALGGTPTSALVAATSMDFLNSSDNTFSSLQFSCTPDSVGTKTGSVDYGGEPYNFTVNVSEGGSTPPESSTCTSGSQTATWDGRTWQRCDDGKTYTWQEAKDYCDNLVLGGYSDWRLPTNDELRSLVVCTNGTPTPLAVYPDDPSVPYSCGSHNDAPYDKPTISPSFECKSENYWSSTKHPEDTYYYNVEFFYGFTMKDNPICNFYVRCVR